MAEVGEGRDGVWDLSDRRVAQVAVHDVVRERQKKEDVFLATNRRVRLVALRRATGNSWNVLFIRYLGCVCCK